MARLCAVLVLLSSIGFAQSSRVQAGPLADRIESILASPELQKNLWGVQVVSLPDGEVIGDDTYYVWEFPDGWTRDDLQWDYGAPVSALTVNDNSVFLDIAPGEKVGDGAAIKLDPVSDYFQVNNRIVTSGPGSKKETGIHRDPGSKQIE